MLRDFLCTRSYDGVVLLTLRLFRFISAAESRITLPPHLLHRIESSSVTSSYQIRLKCDISEGFTCLDERIPFWGVWFYVWLIMRCHQRWPPGTPSNACYLSSQCHPSIGAFQCRNPNTICGGFALPKTAFKLIISASFLPKCSGVGRLTRQAARFEIGAVQCPRLQVIPLSFNLGYEGKVIEGLDIFINDSQSSQGSERHVLYERAYI